MRMFAAAAAMAACLSLGALGGCATATGGGTGDSGGITGAIAQVQQITQTICGFVPTATTIANIFAAGNPALQSATTIANAICGAVTSKTATLRGATPMVAGVKVQGQFVKAR
jgi:hypothetical protein